MSNGVPLVPVGEVFSGLAVPALGEGREAMALFGLVKVREPDGEEGWSVRVTHGLDDDELLGVLTGYVEHLRQIAAAGWDDGDPTRASGPKDSDG
jgi:hypothetical protein